MKSVTWSPATEIRCPHHWAVCTHTLPFPCSVCQKIHFLGSFANPIFLGKFRIAQDGKGGEETAAHFSPSFCLGGLSPAAPEHLSSSCSHDSPSLPGLSSYRAALPEIWLMLASPSPKLWNPTLHFILQFWRSEFQCGSHGLKLRVGKGKL
jgi:hypothetical protein